MTKSRGIRDRHGMTGTRTHRAWKAMRTRCTNPRVKCYPYYGGRGVKVCERWKSFRAFLADMGECPEGMTLDRIDSDGNYEPGNCRWASVQTQVENRKTRKQKPSGLPKGVRNRGSNFEARRYGKQLGCFPTVEAAVAAFEGATRS